MKEFKDFMGNPIKVGDYVYRNQKLHKVLKLMPPKGEFGSQRIKVDCIYPHTWTKPQAHNTDDFVIIQPEQMTAFLLTHTLPRKFVSDW